MLRRTLSQVQIPIRLAAALAAGCVITAAGASTPKITFDGKKQFPSTVVRERLCGPPIACIIPCVWIPADVTTEVLVEAAGSSTLSEAEYTIVDLTGALLAEGAVPIAEDGKTAEAAISPIDAAEVLATECDSFYAFTLTVSAVQVWDDDDDGEPDTRAGSTRTHTIVLNCICPGDDTLKPSGGAYRVPIRPIPHLYDTSWSVASGLEEPHPALVTFDSASPWIIVEQPPLEVEVPPGGYTPIELPVVILPEAPIGEVGEVVMTVQSLVTGEVVAASATLRLVPPEAPCPPGADCGFGCGGPTGNCFEPHPGQGCDDPACCETVCAQDPYCCTYDWDEVCVQQAEVLCGDVVE